MIGILITVQINTWNENRKEQELVLSIFEEIQEDLQSDIEYVDILIEGFRLQEHALNSILSDTLEIEDFEKNHMLIYAICSYIPMITHKDGFNRLKEISNSLNEEGLNIFNQLKEIFYHDQFIIDNVNTSLEKAVNDNRQFLVYEKGFSIVNFANHLS